MAKKHTQFFSKNYHNFGLKKHTIFREFLLYQFSKFLCFWLTKMWKIFLVIITFKKKPVLFSVYTSIVMVSTLVSYQMVSTLVTTLDTLGPSQQKNKSAICYKVRGCWIVFGSSMGAKWMSQLENHFRKILNLIQNKKVHIMYMNLY